MKQNTVANISMIFLVFIIIILTFFQALNSQKEMAIIFQELCNEKYGKDSWELTEKERISFSEKTYIGQIWECTNKNGTNNTKN